jgi:hypothetical protein
MPKIGVDVEEATSRRLREFLVKKTGTLRGQSKLVEKAIIEYLDNHEHELLEQGNPEGIPALA